MDSLLQELNTRFSEDSKKITSIMSLVPKVIIELPNDDLELLADNLHFWDRDMPSPYALKVNLLAILLLVLSCSM